MQWLSLLRRYGTLIAVALISLVFAVLSPTAFATVNNWLNISRQISLLVLVAIGATLVMAVGEFDLSVGALASLGGVIATLLAVRGYPLALAHSVPVVVGLGIGWLNGWVVTRFRVLSFITTLAAGTMIGGATFWLTGGTTIFEGIPDGFRWLGQTRLGAVPLPSLLMLAASVLFWFVLIHTEFGRRLYAIGGNPEAARLAGVRVARDKNLAFALCGGLAALTGAVLASRLGSAHPTAGNGLFLPAYAAAFLGMTAFREGVPNVWGTLVGALMVGVLANGLTILRVPSFLQDILTGAIVVLAVVLQKLGRRER